MQPFLEKKVAICLGITGKICNFAAVKTKTEEEMTRQNLISILFTIRLRHVVGGDRVCI